MSAADWAALARRASVAVWCSYLVLLVQQLADVLVHAAPWIIWLAKLLPLLIFLPGLLRGRLRSYLWLCFVCLGYFVALVERIFAQPGSVLVLVGMAAVIVLFNSSMLFVRWRSRELKACRDQVVAGLGEADA